MAAFYLKQRKELALLSVVAAYQKEIDGGASAEGLVAQARAEGKIAPEHLPLYLRWYIVGDKPVWRSIQYRLGPWFPGLVPTSVDYDPQMLALFAFEVLGTNAAPAMPELKRLLAGRKMGDHPRYLMVSLGESAWTTAREYAASKSPVEREQGAFLLGALRVRPDETVPLLFDLLEDPADRVRKEALKALAEFPCARTEEYFRGMLASARRESEVREALYGLHAFGSAAFPRYIDAYEANARPGVRQAVLAVLTSIENFQLVEAAGASFRCWYYHSKKAWFEKTAIDLPPRVAGIDQVELWKAVRAKLLAEGPPSVQREIFRLQERARKETAGRGTAASKK